MGSVPATARSIVRRAAAATSPVLRHPRRESGRGDALGQGQRARARDVNADCGQPGWMSFMTSPPGTRRAPVSTPRLVLGAVRCPLGGVPGADSAWWSATARPPTGATSAIVSSAGSGTGRSRPPGRQRYRSRPDAAHLAAGAERQQVKPVPCRGHRQAVPATSRASRRRRRRHRSTATAAMGGPAGPRVQRSADRSGYVRRLGQPVRVRAAPSPVTCSMSGPLSRGAINGVAGGGTPRSAFGNMVSAPVAPLSPVRTRCVYVGK
jgi:hypothetical protein